MIASGPSSAGSAGSQYQGHVSDYPTSRVAFRISAELRSVRFKADNIELFCDDGGHPREDLAPIRLDFTSRRNFEGSRYKVEPDGTETYYKVSGRLLGGNRARGSLIVFVNVENPPGSPQATAPDCSTGGGKYAWHAKRQ